MSHEIMETDNMLSVGEVPWHNLGIVLEEAPSIAQAIVMAGLNWEVGTKPLFTTDKEQAPALATYRKTDNRILGVVGPSYKVLQNQEAFNFFQPFIDAKEAKIETAGSLKNGQRVWVLAKISREDSVIVSKADDRVQKYILLSNSHDGTLAVRVGFTPIRVVCNNTLTMAHDAGGLIRIKHTGNVVKNLEDVREIMNAANAQFEASAEQFRLLARTNISRKDLEKYVRIVFSNKKQQQQALVSGEELTSGERVMNDIVHLFEKGRGNDLPGVKGTMWAAYNAITEHLQYNRGENKETRLDSLWFGSGSVLNKKALQTAVTLSLAKVA